jgi:hypothetical protein
MNAVRPRLFRVHLTPGLDHGRQVRRFKRRMRAPLLPRLRHAHEIALGEVGRSSYEHPLARLSRREGIR